MTVGFFFATSEIFLHSNQDQSSNVWAFSGFKLDFVGGVFFGTAEGYIDHLVEKQPDLPVPCCVKVKVFLCAGFFTMKSQRFGMNFGCFDDSPLIGYYALF